MGNNEYSEEYTHTVMDRRSTKPIAMTQVMGLLSFMFLAMAAGAFLLPPQYFIPAVIIEFILIFAIPILSGRDAAEGREPALGLTGGLALVFAACTGAVLGPTVQMLMSTENGAILLGQASLVTFIVFASCGVYGYLTRRNLSTWSKALFTSLLVLLGFMILSLFFRSNPLSLAIGLGGAILFGLLTAFDFQRMKRSTSDETVMVALNIFLDFINLFTFILNIVMIFNGGFGSRE